MLVLWERNLTRAILSMPSCKSDVAYYGLGFWDQFMAKQYLTVLCLVLYTFFLDGGKFYTVDYFAAISKFYTVDLAGICWSIWNCCTRATFEFKLPQFPFVRAFASCASLCPGKVYRRLVTWTIEV